MTTNNIPCPTDASIILTYRCPMRCKMCNVWQYPTEKSKEIQPEELRTLPKLKFINLTGGEPFIREDLDKIVEECYKHTDRIVISTSGWFEDRVKACLLSYYWIPYIQNQYLLIPYLLASITYANLYQSHLNVHVIHHSCNLIPR